MLQTRRWLILLYFQLYEPYTDNPETSGVMRLDADVLNSVVPRFLRDGWQVVSRLYLIRSIFFANSP